LSIREVVSDLCFVVAHQFRIAIDWMRSSDEPLGRQSPPRPQPKFWTFLFIVRAVCSIEFWVELLLLALAGSIVAVIVLALLRL